MKWIRGFQEASPGLAHVAPFAISPLSLSRVVICPAHATRTRGETVPQKGSRQPDTVISKFQAKINVVEDDRQINLFSGPRAREFLKRITSLSADLQPTPATSQCA